MKYSSDVLNKFCGITSVFLLISILVLLIEDIVLSAHHFGYMYVSVIYIVIILVLMKISHKNLVHSIRFTSLWIFLILGLLKMILDLISLFNYFTNSHDIYNILHVNRTFFSFLFILSAINELVMIGRKCLFGKKDIAVFEIISLFLCFIALVIYIKKIIYPSSIDILAILLLGISINIWGIKESMKSVNSSP